MTEPTRTTVRIDVPRVSNIISPVELLTALRDYAAQQGPGAGTGRVPRPTPPTRRRDPDPRGAGYCWRRVNQPTRRLHSHTTPRYRFGDTNRISSRTMRATSEVFE